MVLFPVSRPHSRLRSIGRHSIGRSFRSPTQFGPTAAAILAGLLVLSAATGQAADVAMQRLLETVEVRGRQATTNAQQRFRAAAAVSQDARLAQYAYGVVLMRLFRQDDAREQITQAAEGNFPPALQALLYLQLSQQAWDAASGTALRFAEVLGKQPEQWSDPAVQSRAARWLGQAVAGGQILATQADDVKLWLETDKRIRPLLPAELLQEYAAGFDETLTRQEQLQAEAEQSRAEAREQQTLANASEQQAVVSEKKSTESAREQLKTTAQLTRKSFDDRLVEVAKQLGTLEKDWTEQDGIRQSLERSILLVGQEITVIQQQMDLLTSNNQQASPLRLNALDQQLANRNIVLLRYQADRNRVIATQQGLQRQALQLLAVRQQLVSDFEQLTGEIQRKDLQLDRWKARLTQKELDLQKEPKGNTAAVNSQSQKLRSISAYLAWDWEAERQRLLMEAK